ncbi:MAG: diguanylate cyclase [Candidatus Omnitrophica bacterium]|nr:diguanylate cyclase [Candidatus Omnitrophota bacterium]HOX54479.1 diguanylate cyclase [Candidatus Omnitrophota bacterium]
MLKDKRILLAETDHALVEILKTLLLAMGTKVTVVGDSHSLIETASKEHPDLIMVDCDVPQIDGFNVTKDLKTDFLTSYIPLIILIDKKQIRKKMLQIEQGIDDYIVKPPDPIDLEVRIDMALRRTEHQVHANALTKLPGSREIEKLIKEKLHGNHLFSFAYLDINNFKSFNDKYGYLKGDSLILQTAHIISSTVKRFGNKSDFVGHIGGDDFVIITNPEKEEIIAKEIIKSFDRLIPLHYNKEDRDKGFIRVEDRSGKARNIPLMSVCIAVINNKIRKIHNIIQLTEIAFEIKKYLKTVSKSSYLIDRRSQDHGMYKRQENLALIQEQLKIHQTQKSKYFKPLGQILLENQLITHEQLSEALKKHWLSSKRLGEVLINMGVINVEQLDKVLADFKNSVLV